MRKRILLIALLTMMPFMMVGCSSSTDKIEKRLEKIEESIDSQSKEQELKKQLETAENQVSALKQQLEGNTMSEYLSLKFYQDGKTRKPYEEFKFFSDYYCTKELKTEIIIISPTIDELKLSNGMKVYASLSESGMVYCPEYPSFYDIE